MERIDRFSGPHRFLSNFHPSPIFYEGRCWPTVEHAYQAAKTHDEEEKKKIWFAFTPGQAKRLGRSVSMRPDWDKVKQSIMKELVTLKFRIPDLKRRLRNTGTAELVEGNHWGDTYWGVCNGEGMNVLGKILMEVRDSLEQQ